MEIFFIIFLRKTNLSCLFMAIFILCQVRDSTLRQSVRSFFFAPSQPCTFAYILYRPAFTFTYILYRQIYRHL